MHRRKRDQEKSEEVEKKLEYTLDEAMRTDLRESFDFFKSETGKISRENVKSIMSNFGWINCSSSDLERSIEELYPTPKEGKKKEEFVLQDVKFRSIFFFKIQNFWSLIIDQIFDLVGNNWCNGGGKQKEFNEIFAIFDKKNRNAISSQDIRSVFDQFLDIQISDEDIGEFVKEFDDNNEGLVSYANLIEA